MEAKSKECSSRFPIPLSLHDLEREPYNLLPYPVDFEDDHDETVRSNSFSKLVVYIEQGNRYLNNANDDVSSMMLFPSAADTHDDDEDQEEPWMDDARIQALYTLVR
jgi:hypothetical protein